jgi:hypothetical protein
VRDGNSINGCSKYLKHEIFPPRNKKAMVSKFNASEFLVIFSFETHFFLQQNIMTDSRRGYTATVWLTLTWMILLWYTGEYYKRESTIATKAGDTVVTLVPGDLPCYTGWARPEQTLAGFFHIVSRKPSDVLVGEEWNVTLRCTDCGDKGDAQFYARAYGPAVLAGNVHAAGDGSYTVGLLPMDPGSYTVEVVLVSSNAPSWNDFPVVGQEPSYEGYLLSGFPVQFQVSPNKISFVPHTCSLQDLVSENSDSEYHKARWVVVDKVAHATHVMATNDTSRVSLEGYQSAHNALGVFMDYRPQYCSLLPFQESSASLVNCNMAKHVHVIFIGDSVMRMQYELFRSSVPNVKTTFVLTSGGIVQTMSNVTSRLVELKQFSNERRFLLFNTGLHDIAQLCSRRWRRVRQTYLGPDSNFSCTAQYRYSLGELVDFIREYPAERKVFQSTTAGTFQELTS